MENKKQHIELRSEKVRNIMGVVPPLLLRQGATIIGLILVVLVGISAIIPYQKNINVQLHLYSIPSLKIVTAPTNGVLLLDNLPTKVTSNSIIAYLQHNNKLLPIKTPISGKIISNTYHKTAISKGELLFVIIPQNIKICYAEGTIALADKSQIKKGQKVIFTNTRGKLCVGTVTIIYPLQTVNNRLKIRIALNCATVNNLYITKQQGKIVVKKASIFNYFLDAVRGLN